LREVLTAALFVVLGAISVTNAQTTPQSTARFFEFKCADGQRFNARFDSSGATVLYRGLLFELKGAASESGYQYTNPTLTLIGKGRNASLETVDGRTLASDCVGGATLSGTVTYPQRIALPENAMITVQLVEVSRAGAPAVILASQQIPVAGRQVPVAWTLNYDPSWLAPTGRHTVRATITVNGRLSWTSDTAITVGQPNQPTENLEIRVVQVQPAPAAPGLKLEGTAWELEAVVVSGQSTPVSTTPQTRPTVAFSADGTRVSGNTGCNGFGGSYTTQGNTLTVANLVSTLRACEPDISQLEARFVRLLSTAQRFEADATTLRIVSAEGTLVFRRASATPSAATSIRLPGTAWELERYETGNFARTVTVSRRPTLRFEAGDARPRVSGFAGCNGFSAPYNAQYGAQGNTLKVGAAISTKIACPATQTQLETAFLTLLQRAQGFTVTEATLKITSSDGSLTFRRVR
jgi:putative lipoprotein